MHQKIHPDNYCVIMAGGIGSRFWPMSRTYFPKQFHDILGTGQTLLQMTFDRFLSICPPENILVVTNAGYVPLVQEQLPQLSREQLIIEPLRKNTAPCIAYANHRIATLNPNARIVVAPSDHLILKEAEFAETVHMALDLCSTNDALFTLGIKPTRPDTGYGYIQFTGDSETEIKRVKQVKTFTEKPVRELAEEFIQSGDFCWNSGIFIWSLNSIRKEFEKHLPDVEELFSGLKDVYNTDKEEGQITNVYTVCENISIDYGILEKAENVKVVLSDIGWSDLGTWGSLYNHIEDKDEQANAVLGELVVTSDSSGNIIKSPAGKLVAIYGLKDHIVIDTGDVLMICPLSEEQNIKHLVNEVRLKGGEEFV